MIDQGGVAMGKKRLGVIWVCLLASLVLASSSLLAQGDSDYYLGTSANGYQVPRDGGLKLEPVTGKDGWYRITIDFTEENRDPMYDGHFYKVTDGTWNADGCWGVDNYAFQPAPVKTLPDGSVAGLGSIYIRDNCTLTILFDANTKTIYDDSVQAFPTPRIYGDFNKAMGRGTDWSMADGEALTLVDQNGDGIYTGFYEIPKYEGSGNGYMMATVLSTKYDPTYYMFGAYEQYLFDGNPAGMGKISYLKPEKDTIYEFRYDSNSHSTSIVECITDQIVQLPSPVIYGDFNGWNIEGPFAVQFERTEEGTYTVVHKFSEYKGDGDGYMILVCISKKFYNDQWGMRWGAHEQYKLDGQVAGMGEFSYLKPDKDTVYRFTFYPESKITEVEPIQ